jgi:8-oxo-dGTP pyrophosphatase MutT (NUDIX family)
VISAVQMRKRIQLECIVFRKNKNKYEYLLLKRIPEKGGFWQPPCGGMEDIDKTKLDAAYREIFEETGLSKDKIIKVIEDVHYFVMSKHYLTNEPMEPVEEFALGFEVKSDAEIDIAKNNCVEHEEYRWVSFEDAIKLLKWENNKDAFRKLRKVLNN